MIGIRAGQQDRFTEYSEKTLSAMDDYQFFENETSLLKLIYEVEN